MEEASSFLKLYSQNSKLGIRLNTPSFGRLFPEIIKGYGLTHRKPNYFFLFMVDGASRHGVDLQQFKVKANQLLFILPNQIHQLPLSKDGTNYYKLSFDETCLSLLPEQFPFLVNPLNNQQVSFDSAGATRIKPIFEILRGLLSSTETDPKLILVYLTCLLTEINKVYFSTHHLPADHNLSRYIDFKLLIESNYTEHPTVKDIAEQMAVGVSSLYNIVKHYSGVSPKEFINNRLMLEARRRLYYSESTSVKELAYDLGFNDPEYFARLFKKTTGKTIAQFANDLSGS